MCLFLDICTFFSGARWSFLALSAAGNAAGPPVHHRRKFGSWPGSVACALGVQSREIWQVFMELLSVELKPSKTIENPHVRPTIMVSENRKQTRISLHRAERLEPASSAVGSDGSFLFAAYTRKNVLLAHRLHTTATSPRLTRDTGHHQTWRAYAPLS